MRKYLLLCALIFFPTITFAQESTEQSTSRPEVGFWLNERSTGRHTFFESFVILEMNWNASVSWEEDVEIGHGRYELYDTNYIRFTLEYGGTMGMYTETIEARIQFIDNNRMRLTLLNFYPGWELTFIHQTKD
jgi:hypothetical protein